MSKRGKKAKAEAVTLDDLATPEARGKGEYAVQQMAVTAGEFEGESAGNVRVLRNGAVSQVDKWITAGGFGYEGGARTALEWVQGLWTAAGYAGPVMPKYGRQYGAGPGDGQAQQDALTELSQLKRKFGTVWNVFEDIVRHDMSPGGYDRKLAAPGSRGQNYARSLVGFVAYTIAVQRGF